ncbi:MAG: methyltransferase [Pseudohongiella sp.]|nr:MAG: methyltransferase [Pseudohongiella sp.]
MAALDMAALERAMANPDRPAADKERDASRQAPAVLNALGLEAGMTVLDINASGGWYTEVLSYAVGPNGKVLMQNRPGGRAAEAATAKADRLANVEEWLVPISDIPANSVDFAITALNFHDFHNSNPAAAQGILAQVMGALKSGGILGVIDHEGTYGADNEALHRIAFEDAVKAVLEAGFVLAGASDVLDNDADDHTVGPFDPSLERNTDRIVLKFMKL